MYGSILLQEQSAFASIRHQMELIGQLIYIRKYRIINANVGRFTRDGAEAWSSQLYCGFETLTTVTGMRLSTTEWLIYKTSVVLAVVSDGYLAFILLCFIPDGDSRKLAHSVVFCGPEKEIRVLEIT